ncbi:MAG: polysaccharide deacetylase family protein [Euryarchaeota archaeon]|nr:polysaccharide deacetylase family protein [Euryarchaeota archaeon]
MRPSAWVFVLVLLSGCISGSERVAELSRYPHGFPAAVVITLETEVVRGDELSRVVGALRERGLNATFFVVAGYFESTPEVLEPLRGFEVGSMGWSQPGWAVASSSERRWQMERAHEWLAEHGFAVAGFRAPYLNSSREVLRMVAGMGYLYDSSIPYGLEPYVVEGVVEVPVSVNFDPFWDAEKMRVALPAAYLTFQRAYDSGGVFTLLTHVHTASGNLENFTAFLDYMRERRVWFATAGELARWWRLRENLELRVEGDELVLRNANPVEVRGATAVVRATRARGAADSWRDPERGVLYVVFPGVPPGGEVRVEVEWE